MATPRLPPGQSQPPNQTRQPPPQQNQTQLTLPIELWRLVLQHDPANLAAISQVDRNAHQGSLVYNDSNKRKMEALHAQRTYISIFTNNTDPEIRAAAATEILRRSQGHFYAAQQHSLFKLGLQLSRVDFLKPFMTEQLTHRVLLEVGPFYQAIQRDANLAATLDQAGWLTWPFYELVMPDRGSLRGLLSLNQNSTVDEIIAAVQALADHIGSIPLNQVGQADTKPSLVELTQLVLLLGLTEAFLPLIRVYGLIPARDLDQEILRQVSYQADRDLMLRLLSVGYLVPSYYAYNLVRHGIELKDSYPTFYVMGPTDLVLGSLTLGPGPNSATALLDYGQAVARNPAEPGLVPIHSDWTVPLCQELIDRNFTPVVVGDVDEIYLSRADGTELPGPELDPGNPNWPSFDVSGGVAMALYQAGEIDVIQYYIALFSLVRGNYQAGRHYGPDPISLLNGYRVDFNLVANVIDRMEQYRPGFPLSSFLNAVIFLWRDGTPGLTLSQIWASFDDNVYTNYPNWWLAARANQDTVLMAAIAQKAITTPHRVVEKIDLLGLAFWSRKLWPVNVLAEMPEAILSDQSRTDFRRWYGLVEL